MCLVAVGAHPQEFRQLSSTSNVPEELFGGDAVKLEFGDLVFDDTTNQLLPSPFAPFVMLTMDTPDRATIAAGTEFELTYSLSNAVFAERVSIDDFVWAASRPDADGADNIAGNDDDNRLLVTVRPTPSPVTVEREGGGKDTDSVTFKVRVNSDQAHTLAFDGNTNQFTGEVPLVLFALPDVYATDLRARVPDSEGVLKGGRRILVTTTISQRRSGGTVLTEEILTGSCDEMAGCPVVEAVAVISDISNVAGGSLVSLAPTHERAVLVEADGTASDPQRAPLATVQVVAIPLPGSGLRDSDGDLIDGFTEDLAGSLALQVASDGFKDGDVVYIDANGNEKVDGREAFEIADGVASDTVPLHGDELTIYYVPNGDDALKHGTSFTTTAMTEFNDVNNRVRSAEPATALLKLEGIKDTVAKAYAIAPLTSTDTANVRVTCETPAKAGCNVFLDCKDATGMSTFGDAGALIGPNMTVRWSQADIAAALELEAGWEGRLACEVLSNAPITVQILTRSQGVLVNNTATTEGGT